MVQVSIIVNAFNGEYTLDETLDSIFGQQFDDFELIVWNDASHDATVEIVSARQDPRLRYFESSTNLGLAGARAASLKEARGDWVAFLDQDDLWEPGHLKRAMAAVDGRADVAFVYARTLRFWDQKRRVDYDHRHEYTPLPSGRIFTELFEDSCFIAMGSVVFRRSALCALPPMPAAISACPDYFIYLHLAYHHEVAAVQEVGCYYRMHNGNMTKRFGARMHREILWLLEQWRPELSSRLYRRRCRIHQTNLAVCQFTQDRTYVAALCLLLREGSISYLLTRPLAIVGRHLKRRFLTPEWALKRHQRAELLRTRVSAYTYEEAIATVEGMVTERQGGYVSCANAYGLSLASGDDSYRRLLNGADLVTTDGMPVVWVLRAMGYRCDRVHNDDLVLSLCERNPNWRVVLVGGRQGQPEAVAQELCRRFPAISVVGLFATPQRPVPAQDSQAIVEAIRNLGADIVFVGMGTPAQDHWMAAVADRVDAPLLACGSLFDLLAGNTRPAPEWMKRSGLQWLFRLALEPRRLASRYLRHNTRFVILALRDLLRRS